MRPCSFVRALAHTDATPASTRLTQVSTEASTEEPMETTAISNRSALAARMTSGSLASPWTTCAILPAHRSTTPGSRSIATTR